jgi:integrase
MKKRQSNASKGLPMHLSMNTSKGITNYRYRNRQAKVDKSLGTNRAAAIRAANQANSILFTRTDLTELIVGSRMKMSELCAKFLKVVNNNVNGLGEKTQQERRTMMNKVLVFMPDLPLEQLTVLKINEFFDWVYDPEEDDEESGTPNARNATRKNLIPMVQYALKKGYIVGTHNPVSTLTEQIPTKRITKRHTYEGWNAIYDHKECPSWLRCAMNIGLTTLQRRGDVCNIKMPKSTDTYIEVIQQKTQKFSNTGYIKIEITPALREVINECRDNLVSPYLIHRKPRNRKFAREGELDFTKVTPDFLSFEFNRIRKLANPYPNLTLSEQPGFHQGKALGIYLIEQQTKEYPQQLAGHASVNMTKNYGKGHEEIEWSYATPTLNVLDRGSILALKPSTKSA